MNLASIRTETSYSTESYEVVGRKNAVWKKQSANQATNDKVQEDLDKKVSDKSARKEKADRIVDDKVNGRDPGNWAILADDNGVITYNGICFLFDSETNSLSLGDMSQEDNVLSIPLSRGGTLKVNRNNIDDLAKAIGMFSPEDINRIMRAISEDAHCRRKLNEIEDDKNSLGEEEDSVKNQEEYAKQSVKNTQNFHDSDNFKRVWNEYFKGADKSVERIWKETMEETGVDGFGYNNRGMLTHITQFQVAQLTMSYREQSVFGSTVGSALDFAKRSLDSLRNPLMPLSSRSSAVQSAIMAEQRFYEKFIEKLSLI